MFAKNYKNKINGLRRLMMNGFCEGKQTTKLIIWRTGRENGKCWAGNEFGTKHKGLFEKQRLKA